MCDFASFFIHENAKELGRKSKTYLFGDMHSHSETARMNKQKYDSTSDKWRECEWTQEAPEYLTVRGGSAEACGELKKIILADFPNRSALLAHAIKHLPKGVRGVITQADADALPEECGDLLVLSGDLELPCKKAGNIYANSATSFTAPALTTVSGSLYASAATSFTAPALTTVSGSLYASAAASFSAPALTEVKGSLDARAATSFSAPALTEVKGSLDARAATSFSAPALTECGYLYASAATSFSAPALTECGSLYASAATSFTAPALTEVKGSLDARAATSFTAPALTKCGSLDARAATSFTAPALT